MISIITKNTKNTSGQIWEINCAKQEGMPIFVGVYGNDEHLGIKNIQWMWICKIDGLDLV